MKESPWLSLASACLLVLTGCATDKNGPGSAASTGPFDEQGNYRDDWADDPGKWSRPSGGSRKPVETVRTAANDQPPSDAVPLPSGSERTQSSPPRTAKKAATATYKPQAKPKSKPKPTRYTVKSGDSLYAIALRNGTSVSALRKANGISGSLIRPGQSLVIPKR